MSLLISRTLVTVDWDKTTQYIFLVSEAANIMSLAQHGCLNERYLVDVKREAVLEWHLQSQYLSSEYGRADLYFIYPHGWMNP